MQGRGCPHRVTVALHPPSQRLQCSQHRAMPDPTQQGALGDRHVPWQSHKGGVAAFWLEKSQKQLQSAGPAPACGPPRGLWPLCHPVPLLPQRHPGNLTMPEHTVELRGATVTWASKDKSSKKHVLEVSSVAAWGPWSPSGDHVGTAGCMAKPAPTCLSANATTSPGVALAVTYRHGDAGDVLQCLSPAACHHGPSLLPPGG